MCLEDIKYYVNHYYIKNGEVYLFLDNLLVEDEEVILKAKAARFIYNETMKQYQKDSRLIGYSDNNIDQYIKKTMEKWAIFGEKNKFGINKMIHGILDSDGYYEEEIRSNCLEKTKFSVFLGKDKDYAIAYLQFLFQKKRIKMSDFGISYKKGKVIITFKKAIMDEKKNSGFLLHDLQGDEKMAYATEQLEIATLENNGLMIKYWEDTILNMQLLKSN